MNCLHTLYISTKKFGTIIALPSNLESFPTNKYEIPKVISHSADSGSKTSPVRITPSSIYILSDAMTSSSRIDLQLLESKVVDEPLRKLSTVEYIIITDKYVMHNGKVYQTFPSISTVCHWIAIPIAKEADIIDYKTSHPIDEFFISQGYVKELKEASHILIPPDMEALSPSCMTCDLLIRKVEEKPISGGTTTGSEVKRTYIPFSARKGSNINEDKTDGRYIYLSSMPKFEGIVKDPPFTYSMRSLISKYETLQKRLQAYGKMKVESLCTSMQALSSRFHTISNQYRASSVYDDVVDILEKIREMS